MASGSWITDGNGNWTDSLNWNGGTIADGAGFTADFTNNITNNTSVSLNGTSRTIGTLNFSDGGAADKTWTITRTGAETLTVTTINTVTDTTIAVPIATTLTKSTGTAKLTLTGGSSSTSAWAINAGTLEVTTTAITGATGVVTVGNGATLTSSVSFAKPITANAGSTITLSGATTGALIINTRNFTLTGSATSTLPSGTTIASGLGLVGILTIGPSRTVTSGAGFSGSSSTGAAAIYQTGASSNFNRSNTGAVFLSSATGAYGYYRGSSGTIGASGSAVTLQAVDGVFDFNGVSVTSGGVFRNVYAGYSSQNNNAALVLYRGGINYTHGTTGIFGLNWSTAETGGFNALVATGTNTVAAFPGTSQFNGAASSHSVAVAHNGGTLQIASTTRQGSNTSGVHLNGGTFTVTSQHASQIPVTLFGTGNKISAGASTGVLLSPIQNVSASTFGVTSVTGGTGGAGYIGPPVVKPATANMSLPPVVSATWDADGTITGYTIHSPGAYTSSASVTPTMTGGGSSSAVTAPTLVLSANSTDGNIEKVDSGTVVFADTNTYTGTTTVTAGTLSIGNAGAAGTLGLNDASSVVIVSGKTLNFNRNDSRTYTGVISGAGGITKTTTGGTAILDADNTFTGTVQATTGALRAVRNQSFGLGASALTTGAGGAIELANNITVARPVTLTGTGVSSTGAIRNISGNNEITGVITLSGSTSIGSDSGTLNFSSTSTCTISIVPLSFVGNGDVDFSPKITVTGSSVTKASGTGAAILRAVNNYTQDTVVTTGFLGYVGAIISGLSGNFGNTLSSTATKIAENAGIRYYGTGNVLHNRSIQLTGATANATYKLESNGTGAVTHSTLPTFGSANVAKTMRLGGTGTASNTVSYATGNNGTGAVKYVKGDAGKWVFTNRLNAHTGGTDVGATGSAGGTLVLSIGATADEWAANRSVTNASAGTVTVYANSKIQTLSGPSGSANRQLGRHTYNNLTLKANSRILIGG